MCPHYRRLTADAGVFTVWPVAVRQKNPIQVPGLQRIRHTLNVHFKQVNRSRMCMFDGEGKRLVW